MSKKYSYAQEHCIRTVGKIMQKTEMLYPGAKVGVAISGGVDSFVLLKVLQIRQGIVPFHFDLLALHLNPGFDQANHAPLSRWLLDAGIASHLEVTDYGLQAHSDANLSNSTCFRCAWLRRKRLFNLAKQYHLTHLAFGHNADDLLQTFFLNLCQNGRVEGMSLKESFFGGKLSVIRPMLFVDKKTIIKAANQWQLPIVINICPSKDATKRTDIREKIKLLTGDNKAIYQTMSNAVQRFQLSHDAP
ncbi:MAG: tRNA 2-thiocytidine biosynthesis protein TtcA [Desulfovibrionaceae bacterium]|nr:tRNA 2-thiocytidine biosynthesis protein TtcA [Desulfovibrionaceae bacterium]